VNCFSPGLITASGLFRNQNQLFVKVSTTALCLCTRAYLAASIACKRRTVEHNAVQCAVQQAANL
jgi:hypothetical protein